MADRLADIIDTIETEMLLLKVSPHRVPELRPQLASAEQLGGDTFQLRVSNRSGLVSWLLSQKTDVRVLEPAQIQEDLRTALQALI